MSLTKYPEDISDFPFPFGGETYRYTANLQPASLSELTTAGSWGDKILRIAGDYGSILSERAEILERDPSRFQVLPHMRPATWDAMLYLMQQLATENPGFAALTELGNGRYFWSNARLGLEQHFKFGDESTLPYPPLEFIGRQLTEDVVLLDQRDGELWVDAGLVTFAAIWSFAFNTGMSFQDLHGPIPYAPAQGVFRRAEDFLMRLEPGAAFRRLNWGYQPDRHLDMSMDSYPEWMSTRANFAEEDDEKVGSSMHMRVEVQHLIRLPESGAIMFLISTRLLPISRLALVPEWRDKMLSVLENLQPEIFDYKGLAPLADPIMNWLRARASSAVLQQSTKA